jgi:putative redox protein
MKVYLKQVKGTTLLAKGDSNHWVTLDSSEEFGGSSAASRPMELILMALAGCGSMDIIPILQKKRVELDDYEVHITAERAESHPKVFTKIEIEYVFYGKNISEKDVERAIELSTTKYCSVFAMLKNSVDIKTNYKIIQK